LLAIALQRLSRKTWMYPCYFGSQRRCEHGCASGRELVEADAVGLAAQRLSIPMTWLGDILFGIIEHLLKMFGMMRFTSFSITQNFRLEKL